MKQFKIYATKIEDVNQGWVWLSGCSLPHRSTVRLSTGGTCKLGLFIIGIVPKDPFQISG
jgi:hypothetical protein